MENNQHDIEWIERYLDRSMSIEERRALEKRLKDEPDLKSKYLEHQQLIRGIRYAHLHERLEQLRTLEHGLPKVDWVSGPSAPSWVRVYLKPALVVMTISILAASYLIFYGGRPTDEKLFITYFEPFDSPGAGLTRGQGDDVLTWKQKGYQAYDHGNYQTAIASFENALKEKNDPIVSLCLGNAYLSLNQPEKAEEVFQSVLENHDDLITQTKWYLALTYLKQDKTEMARASLWEISKSSTYGEKARKLLKELD